MGLLFHLMNALFAFILWRMNEWVKDGKRAIDDEKRMDAKNTEQQWNVFDFGALVLDLWLFAYTHILIQRKRETGRARISGIEFLLLFYGNMTSQFYDKQHGLNGSHICFVWFILTIKIVPQKLLCEWNLSCCCCWCFLQHYLDLNLTHDISFCKYKSIFSPKYHKASRCRPTHNTHRHTQTLC